jgi:GNAT superfamily N-acetyltransferase
VAHGWQPRAARAVFVLTTVERLQAFLRAVAAPGRAVIAVSPFTAYLDRSDALRFLNYAIPDGDVGPDREAVERLRAVFREHDRLPRLEWIEEAAPRLAESLAAAGLREELRTPLMACAPGDLQIAEADVADLAIAPVGDADVRDCENLQRVAFGGETVPATEPIRDPRTTGGGAMLARVGGDPVSAASWTRIVDGVTEIVGVATAERWRGRGLAGAVTAAAAEAAFAAGAGMCLLSPGDDVAQRVYARAGFQRVATMLHWSDAQSPHAQT